VGDGFLVHPFHTPQYLGEVILPAIQQGLAKSGRERGAFKVSVTAFAVTSPEEDLFVRAQIGFYASTPSYRAVMDQHGWGETAENLGRLVQTGRWGELPGLISDEMLHTFAVVCDEAHLAPALLERYGKLADRLGLYLPYTPGQRDEMWKGLIRAVQEA
jgi:hypothetical protein